MNTTVVFIDANAEARAWASAELAKSGLSVVGFDGARAFLRMVDGPERLPGEWCVVVDGLSDMTCHQLQAEVARRGLAVPLVFLMNADQLELACALIKAGAADVMQKPIDADELRRRILSVLGAAVLAKAQLDGIRHGLSRLTQRELEVVTLIARGLSNQAVADQLSISFRTVEVHRRNAMRKTGTSNNVELTRFLLSSDPQAANESGQRSLDSLTDREREILRFGNEGLTNKAIALRLSISAGFEAHRRNAMRKTRTEPGPRPPVSRDTAAHDPGLFAFELRAKGQSFELELRVAWAHGEATVLWEFESTRGLSLVSFTSSERVDESFRGHPFPARN